MLDRFMSRTAGSPKIAKTMTRMIAAAMVALCLGTAVARADRQTVSLSGDWKLWADREAQWVDDELYLPPVDLAKLPKHPPTGGWATLQTVKATEARVPGTAEEFLADGNGPMGANPANAKGVTWWWRQIRIPAYTADQRVRLCFAAARVRAEVFLDEQLVGYNLVDSTPFEVDLTPYTRPNETHRLAVRITNPGGNYAWNDGGPLAWGKHIITNGRAFGGLTGDVSLVISDSVSIDDLYLQNTPNLHKVHAFVTVHNASRDAQSRRLEIRVVSKADPSLELFRQTFPETSYPPGDSTIDVPIEAPVAQAWDLDHPNLYLCQATLTHAGQTRDHDERVFGFRWFSPEGIGSNAIFRLNGKRIVLRSAISWGLFPLTGMVPTQEIARRQIQAAKAFGLNMLNFHRCIGTPNIFDQADEAGLLYYEEPGGYQGAGNDAFARDYATIKLLRMIKRDRSHPSLILYTLINEYGVRKEQSIYDRQAADMAAAHRLDPSRMIVFASGWANKPGKEEPVKLNMRPFDDKQYQIGWYDYHRAGGPATYSEREYQDPKHNAFATDNLGEILFWGEENAISTPPRLELIKRELTQPGVSLGWDGQVYLKWETEFEHFLDDKGLRKAFPTVDSLCTAMGEVSLYHQGHRVELARMQNVTDGYVTNGWDATTIDNHSGIVDAFRFPKADPSLIARFNQPLYVAVVPRTQVVQVQDRAVVDFYLVNEKDIKGPHRLSVKAINKAGVERFTKTFDVTPTGGEVYGEPLALAVAFDLKPEDAGFVTIQATLITPDGKTVTQGHETFLAVNWQEDRIAGRGAVYEWGSRVGDYLKNEKQISAAAFDDTQGPLDWLVIARPPQGQPQLIPADGFADAIKTSIFPDANTNAEPVRRSDATIDFACADGAAPDPAVSATTYTVRWEGQLKAPTSGTYILGLDAQGAAKLDNNNGTVLDSRNTQQERRVLTTTVEMTAGKPLSFRLTL
ncbi:MAG: PA14 domain-containing protein [Tepidisphaeraceae bacterium]